MLKQQLNGKPKQAQTKTEKKPEKPQTASSAETFSFEKSSGFPLDNAAYAELSKLVRSIYLFKGLRAGEIDSICQRLKLFGFPPEHTILKHGEEGSSFYIIYQGNVKVVSKGGFLKKGMELAKLGPGGYFGEISHLRQTLWSQCDYRWLYESLSGK